MLHGQTRYNLKSRFFDELPQEALKWITPKQPAYGSGFGGGHSGGYDGAMNSGASGAGYTRATGQYGKNSTAFSGAGVPVQKEAGAHGLRANMKVFHNKFGEGTVLTLEGVGDDARAQVTFPRHGVKWLALSVAKLTPI